MQTGTRGELKCYHDSEKGSHNNTGILLCGEYKDSCNGFLLQHLFWLESAMQMQYTQQGQSRHRQKKRTIHAVIWIIIFSY